jgi:hypothetical protein
MRLVHPLLAVFCFYPAQQPKSRPDVPGSGGGMARVTVPQAALTRLAGPALDAGEPALGANRAALGAG